MWGRRIKGQTTKDVVYSYKALFNILLTHTKGTKKYTQGEKYMVWAFSRGNGLANCLATGNGSTTATLLQGPHTQGQCTCVSSGNHSVRRYKTFLLFFYYYSKKLHMQSNISLHVHVVFGRNLYELEGSSQIIWAICCDIINMRHYKSLRTSEKENETLNTPK